MSEFARQLELRGRPVACVEHGADLVLTVRSDAGIHRLTLADRAPSSEGSLEAEEIWVATAIDDATFGAVPAERAAFDLGAARVSGPGGRLFDAFREFLRKRGVRLEPRTWTYPGGWL